MRKLNFKLLMILGISLAMVASVFTACEDNTDPPTPPTPPVGDSIVESLPTEIPISILDNTSVPCFFSSDDTIKIKLFNSNENLQEWCNTAQEFDFSNGSLLAIAGFITSGVDTIKIKLDKTSNLQYSLSVDIAGNASAVIEKWCRFVWIPEKIESEEQISLHYTLWTSWNFTALTDISSDIPCGFPHDDTVKLINSNSELQALCNDAPHIDFTNSSLLIVSGTVHGNIQTIENQFSKYYIDWYSLIIEIETDDAEVAVPWQKCYLTEEKISPNDSIWLKYIYNGHHNDYFIKLN